MYNDEVVQVMGGMNDYVGVLDQREHPLGKEWMRIKEPCLIFQRENPQTKQLGNVIVYMPGMRKTYRKYVDIRIPADMPMEIRTVDKNGDLYKVYQAEISRKPSRIILPEQVLN